MEQLSNIQKAVRAEYLRSLEMFKWNISQACRHMGISRVTYYRNAKRFNLTRPPRA